MRIHRLAVLPLASLVMLSFVHCSSDDQGVADTSDGPLDIPGIDDLFGDDDAADSASPTPDILTPAEVVTSEVVEPGAFGAACQGNEDCTDGWCVEGPSGYVCSRQCVDSCPPGWDCRGVRSGTDIAFICVPRFDRLCAPCTDDTQCNGGRCLTFDGEQRCARPCDGPETCPDGFGCSQVGDARACIPETGSCSCFSEYDGGLRTCVRANGQGSCYGVEDCDPAVGWGACNAAEPVAEMCNGLDDNCNAFVDEDLAGVGQPCLVEVAGVGACPGTTTCAGGAGLVCQGRTPAEETCNFIDDNCQGGVDEPFKTGEIYTAFDHCGTCNRSCAVGFPNAAQTACQVQQGVAQCVVVQCQPGYIKQNDFQCIPDIVNLCEPCSDNSNCLGQDSACVTLSDGKFCAKACDVAGDCPTGFACQTVAGLARRQCLPTTGVCSCGPATLGLSRACTRTVAPPGQPSYTCAGTETCSSNGWGACVMPAESCNGVDDDCDGTVDEGFRNAAGRYDRVENCGACGVSCLALTFANAAPVCNAAGADVPRCGFQCNNNWFDLDGVPGCECQRTSTTDVPDVNGADVNCDGIDGELARSVFVAKTGDDTNDGTFAAPLRTIQAGIAMARLLGRRDVLVATGVYVESIALENAVNVYGGYTNDFRQRDTFAFETAILGVEPTDALRGAVNATGVATTTGNAIVFDGFSVFGADNSTPGGNSYAVYLRNVGPHLTVRNNYIVGGNGGNGGAGSKGADGARGGDGADGTGAILGPNTSVDTTCSSTTHEAAGGAGGAQTCGGTSTAGGGGGRRVCPNNTNAGITTTSHLFNDQRKLESESGGAGANNAGAGGGGLPGYHQRIAAGCSVVSSPGVDTFGAPGGTGRLGVNGEAGAACVATSGSVNASGHWVSSSAAGSLTGTSGGGGGGGGAGGGISNINCVGTSKFGLGGAGGGGGAGGCAGAPGTAGASGGGSFGVFLAYTTAPSALPTIRDNTIVRGRGGVGGAGGAGGSGGAGGLGGLGGPANRATFAQADNVPGRCCSAGGGAGGAGGAGGHGPGGGGGCGGSAFALYVAPVALNVARTNIVNNTLPTSGGGGLGGAGGTSLGNVGQHGGIGLNNQTNY